MAVRVPQRGLAFSSAWLGAEGGSALSLLSTARALDLHHVKIGPEMNAESPVDLAPLFKEEKIKVVALQNVFISQGGKSEYLHGDTLSDPLPAEVETSFNFETTAGDHTIYVVLDTDDEVEESNEGNNTYSTVVTVGGRIGDPNLSISYFDYYADEDTILYAVDVYNGGGKDVGNFYVDLWVHAEDDPTASGIGDEFLLVDGLEAGGTEYVFFEVDVADLPAAYEGCEYCWSWAMVDTNDYVEETDEDDNVTGPIEVEVPQP